MLFSKSTEYAIRSLVYLAVHSYPDQRFGTRQMAEDMSFPEPYLAKILQQLAKNNLIYSVKGPNGGFWVDQIAMDITLLEVIASIDGLAFFDSCGLGLHECDEEKPCPIHKDYQIFRGDFYKMLSEKTIRQMKEEIDLGIAFMDI